MLGDLTVALAIGLGVVIPIRVCTDGLPAGGAAGVGVVPFRGSVCGGVVAGAAGKAVCPILACRSAAIRRAAPAGTLLPAGRLGPGFADRAAGVGDPGGDFPDAWMSWYFDTENYAAGIWNSWAEARTDVWREAMIHAIEDHESAAGRPAPAFSIAPPGTGDGKDFAFLVIGDTGEGDASQHVLRDPLILAALQPEVRFVVISSDVVYPTGEMKDYEANFWLPFKGVAKPVYAIPGNH